MIIDKEVYIKNNGRIKSHYKLLGLDVSNEYIKVPINLLTIGSHAIINCHCDICNKHMKMEYRSYKKHIEYDGLYYCIKCSIMKKEKHNLEKYGVGSYTQTESFKEKTKNTCLERYGKEFYQSSELYKNKIIKTCIEKYGCSNVMQNREIFERQKKSSYSIKLYKKTNLFYQGTYELDFLKKYSNKLKFGNITSIRYGNRFYHPDFYLTDFNLIIEIKSSYTFEYDLEVNIKKRNECIKQGYKFLFIINKNYTELDMIIC